MRASMNFVTPGQGGDVRFVLDNNWTGTGQQPVEVELRDWRSTAGQPSFAREGFVIDRIVSGVTDYRDGKALMERWIPAVRETVLRATGGSWAALFAGPLARFSERNPEAFSSAVSAPARAVHSDLHGSFTFDQFPRQPAAEAAVDEVRSRIGDREPRRWKIFNIWQAISPPPQDVGLALCSLDSVAPSDFVEGKGYFFDPAKSAEEILDQRDAPHQFDITFFRPNPAQKWGYFSDMLPGEALIFSALDPEADSRKARVPHGAITIPGASEHAVPRNSIEIRALVAFGD
ncbi:CmcJ/NvfI family oxidoreductase [Altericroceibacterium xinjiangense]|uniref:CmcJ/NvfI family oxidoreductase n=1 Tax=Altericroceibacterium xinjiangense TaxID=762261 RepID=UPI000F7D90BA|nr:CmcJ/NvfI family oxidoreductase [Altericroceibacterium xinjiangense]